MALRRLNVSKNEKLKRLPEAIGNCSLLMELNASKTAIKDLPDGLRNLEQLRWVDVQETPYDPNDSNNSSLYCSLMINGVDVKIKTATPASSVREELRELAEALGGERPTRRQRVGAEECAQQ